MSAPTQRFVVLFDGTWNDPQDRTNVYRLARDIVDHDDQGVRQRFFNAAVGITVDPSVWQRWQAFSDYRPETLRAAGCRPPGQGASPSG